MAYLAGLVIVTLFFLALKYFLGLTKKEEIIISSIVMIVVFGAIAFNTNSTLNREAMLDVVTQYKQGKSVLCKGIEVNASNYTLSIGTYTFIGKKNTPYYAEMISASTCK